MIKISICIPTYNRAECLVNCLNSIKLNSNKFNNEVEVCISDNCSTDQTEEVVRNAQEHLDIKYHKNSKNLGIPFNFLNVVDMAGGEFVWLLGDDDLLIPSAFAQIINLIDSYKKVDFFYVNSFHLTTEFVFSYPQPFDTRNLPIYMEKFSAWTESGEMNFLELIDPKISFDFLGGMFTSVFRRKNWIENTSVLDNNALLDSRTFSHFDNTFPHIKIFSTAFANSNAYFYAPALSVCLTGAREWAPMYPFIRSVRLIEALNEYRKNGLTYFNYFKCKNFALGFFIPDLVYIYLNRDKSGYEYVKPFQLVLSSALYPGLYLSFFTYFIRKIKSLISN